MQSFKSPLNIYIVWHPAFTNGMDYANYLYSEFCRDTGNPLSRGIGIPVFFRCAPYEDGKPLAINFGLSERNAVIVLVEDEIFEDEIWTQYFKGLINDKTTNKRIFPIALSKYAYDVVPEAREQFIRLFPLTDDDKIIEFENRCKKLKSELLHDISRMLLNLNITDSAAPGSNPQPVKLFISHAKKDGETMAISFRNYIRSETKLNSFFDANDIANGYDFEKEIAGGIKNSALVVFQTDAYATREWCRIEVISAKRYKSPLVIVNAISHGEKRSFPYIGNAPSIRWNNNFDEIVDLALIQILYNLYHEQLLEGYIKLYKPGKDDEIAYLTLPPELFNYLDIVKLKKNKGRKNIIVLYPDPPLGNEEMKLMNEIDEEITFTTPIMLPGFKF